MSQEIASCGKPNILLPEGIIGRTDMLIVRGINVFPPSIEVILREFVELSSFAL